MAYAADPVGRDRDSHARSRFVIVVPTCSSSCSGIGPGPTSMKVPPSGIPSSVLAAKSLMLKSRGEMDELTQVWFE